MDVTLYQVDAFTDTLFRGNPAAVCPLSEWLDDTLLQSIAEENNLSETAFYVPEDDHFHIRWFTPVCEVDLCGHATLATAHVLFTHIGYARPEIRFMSRSGLLKVRREDELLVLDFPVDIPRPAPPPPGIEEAVGLPPRETLRGKDDYLLVYSRQEDIEGMKPDFGRVEKIPCRGIIVTAPGRSVDFVSRFFGPQSGVAEDPVTGSAHTTLVPYWAGRTGKLAFEALQLSRRGGKLRCTLKGDRVEIGGKARTFLVGKAHLH